MKFFRGRSNRKMTDGRIVLEELLARASKIENAIMWHSEMAEDLTSRGLEFVGGMGATVAKTAYLLFVEQAFEDGRYASQVLDDVKDGFIDLSQTHVVEFMVMATAINSLLNVSDLAKKVAGTPDRIRAFEQMSHTDSPMINTVEDSVAFSRFARTFKLRLGLNASDYYSRYLPETIRPEISDEIAEYAENIFARLRT